MDPKLLDSVIKVIRRANSGHLDELVSPDVQPTGAEAELVDFVNAQVDNLREVATFFTQIKSELPQLVDGILDVLQTIEKATIRVLDNTDGILEQQDAIEQTSDLVKQNPALARVIGARLDKINQSQGKARMFVFDIIQAQEFQELTRKQTDIMVGDLENIKHRLVDLQNRMNLRDQAPGEAVEETYRSEPEPEPEKANQDVVDQLLAEFGL